MAEQLTTLGGMPAAKRQELIEDLELYHQSAGDVMSWDTPDEMVHEYLEDTYDQGDEGEWNLVEEWPSDAEIADLTNEYVAKYPWK